jgi:hypothetical protein
MKKIGIALFLLAILLTSSSCGLFNRNKCNCPHFEVKAHK